VAYFSTKSERKLECSKSEPYNSEYAEQFIPKPYHRNSAPTCTYKPRSSSYVRLNFRKVSMNDADLSRRRSSQLSTIYANHETDASSSEQNETAEENHSEKESPKSSSGNLEPPTKDKSPVKTPEVVSKPSINLTLTNKINETDNKTERSSSLPSANIRSNVSRDFYPHCRRRRSSIFKSPTNRSNTIDVPNPTVPLTHSLCRQQTISETDHIRSRVSKAVGRPIYYPGPATSSPSTGFEMESSMRERQWSVETQGSKNGSQHWRWSFRRCKYLFRIKSLYITSGR